MTIKQLYLAQLWSHTLKCIFSYFIPKNIVLSHSQANNKHDIPSGVAKDIQLPKFIPCSLVSNNLQYENEWMKCRSCRNDASKWCGQIRIAMGILWWTIYVELNAVIFGCIMNFVIGSIYTVWCTDAICYKMWYFTTCDGKITLRNTMCKPIAILIPIGTVP